MTALAPMIFMKKELSLCALSSGDGFANCCEPSKENQLSVDPYVCGPFVSFAMKPDTNLSRRVSARKPHVLGVFSFCNGSEVGYPIVSSDAINVIDVVWDNAVMHNPSDPMRSGPMTHNDGALVPVAVDRGEGFLSGKLAIKYAATHLRSSDFVVEHVGSGDVPCEYPSIGIVAYKLPDAINVHFNPQVADHLSVPHTRKEARHVR